MTMYDFQDLLSLSLIQVLQVHFYGVRATNGIQQLQLR